MTLGLLGRGFGRLGAAGAHGHAAGGYSAQTQQFFDRLITLPSAWRQALYSNLIDALVAGGVWSNLDVLMVMAAEASGTAVTNLVSSSFTPTLVTTAGIPVFTVDRGYTGAGVNSCISSNYNAATAGGFYAQNSAMICCWNLTSAAHANPLWRTIANLNIECWPRYTGDLFLSMLNSSATENSITNSDASGLCLTNRTASNAYTAERNNAILATYSTASVAPENGNLFFVMGPFQGAAYAIGASLTTGQKTTLYNALQTYLHAVGAV